MFTIYLKAEYENREYLKKKMKFTSKNIIPILRMREQSQVMIFPSAVNSYQERFSKVLEESLRS